MTIDTRHEIKMKRQVVDVRPLGTRVGEWLGLPLNFAYVSITLWVLVLIAPVTGVVVLPVIAGLSFTFVAVRPLLPYRYPADRKDARGKPGDGICYIGSVEESSPYERFKEIWFSDSDMRTHWLILATTGSGKSEALKAIFFNCLNWSSGFFIADGKADNQLPLDTYTMVRGRGRDYDYLCLNFLLGGKTPEQARRSRRRRTNGINPFSDADSDTIIQMGANLMPKVEGEAKMWQEKALNLWRAEVTALCYKRDVQGFNISVTTFLEYMALPKLEELYMEGYYEAQTRGGVWSYGFVGIKSYLEAGLPGFKVDRLLRKHGIETAPAAARPSTGAAAAAAQKTDQEVGAYEQHSYRTNQMMPVLGLLDKTYGYIFRAKFSEIDMTDVVLRRRILCMLIPSLEKSAAEAENLGKLGIACLRVMGARNLGSEVEGTVEELLGRKATLAPYPYVCALDELGYFFSDGLAVMFAQFRSLGTSLIASAQDVEMLTSGSRAAEAGAMLANQNIQYLGKMAGGSQKTADIYDKALGKVTVALRRDYEMGETGYRRTADVEVREVERATPTELSALDQGEGFVKFGGAVRRMRWFYMGDDNKKNRVPFFMINRFLQIEPPSAEEVIANSIPMEQLNDPHQRGAHLLARLQEPLDPYEYVQDHPLITALAQAAAVLPKNLPAQERAIALYMAAREAWVAMQPAPSQSPPESADADVAREAGSAEARPAPGAADAPPAAATAPLQATAADPAAGAGSADEEVDVLAFLSGGRMDGTFARKSAAEVLGLDQAPQRARLLGELQALQEEPQQLQQQQQAMDVEAFTADFFDLMSSERTRTFNLRGDLARGRDRGQVIAELVAAPAGLTDPVTGMPVDSRPDWIGEAVLEAQRFGQAQPAADGTVVGLTEGTLKAVEDAERALGSPNPVQAARSAQQVASARVTAPTTAKARLDEHEIDAAMKVLTL